MSRTLNANNSRLASSILAGDRLAVARAITVVENESPTAHELLAAIFPHTGQARLIGVTGAPGAGKSTLVTALALACRRAGQTVAVVAVDPTSPFTGGALLGDRVRMRALSGDPGVFVRSMATRGALGGLSKTTGDVVTVLDAAGFDCILIETVGVGQAEVEIARLAHTTVVVEAPGFGDEVQAIKAGILEIADILVVNKADLPGVERTVQALEMMLALRAGAPSTVRHHSRWLPVETPADPTPVDGWQIPLLKTSAANQEGIEAFFEAIEAHGKWLDKSGELVVREQARIVHQLEQIVRAELTRRIGEKTPHAAISALVDAIRRRVVDPYTAAQRLLGEQ